MAYDTARRGSFRITGDELTREAAGPKPTRARYFILLSLFIASTLSYGDRLPLSFAAPALSKTLHVSALEMGFVLSAFAIAYVLGQIPGGILLDRFGSRKVYALSLFAWSSLTALQGLAGWFGGAVVTLLFMARFLGGLAAAPGMPANARIVTTWFPTRERGLALGIFASTQYIAMVAFAPLMGWLVEALSWHAVFFVMGGAGLLLSIWLWFFIQSPDHHPLANSAEVSMIRKGGALTELETQTGFARAGLIRHVGQLISNRLLIAAFVGQYGLNVVTFFFSTWFPIYLVRERHLSVLVAGFYTAIPAACGFSGVLIGAALSDFLLKRTGSIGFARRAPLIGGMSVAALIVLCNYTHSAVMICIIMSIAFFGKGIASLGWALLSDIAPKERIGVTGGIFNMIGNLAGIVTPIVVGFIVEFRGSFDWALNFVAANCLMAIIAYIAMGRKVERVILP